MKRHTAERDGISKLPAPILHHILSFLSQEEAIRTCVLSKLWRHLGSTRPKFCLKESYFGKDKDKFLCVLEKSLQVYNDQKLSIDDFSVTCVSMVDPELEKWIPIVIHDMGVKIFHLSLGFRKPPFFALPSAVFESESLQEMNLERCNLSKIQMNSFGNKHLKSLILQEVYIEGKTFAKIMSSSSLIECLALRNCKGLRTIKMHNHHNLKSFELFNNGVYLPSIVDYKHFSSLTCLKLAKVPLSNEWFSSFSLNFPFLEKLTLSDCFGFDEFQLSSRSIKYLDIMMDNSTIKATIDAPSIKMFIYGANISQPISFSTTSIEWDSQIHLSLDPYASLWFLKLSEVVAAFSQSQIISLVLFHAGSGNHEQIEHLSDISVCRGSYEPVAVKSLDLVLDGLYYDSFFSDLLNGLFRIIRPREIYQLWCVDAQHDVPRQRNEVVEFLCRTLQMGRSKDEGVSFWRQDLEEVSLEVHSGGFEEWHLVQTTMRWSEYVATLLPLRNISFCEVRFRLKWRDLDNSLNSLILVGLLFVLLFGLLFVLL